MYRAELEQWKHSWDVDMFIYIFTSSNRCEISYGLNQKQDYIYLSTKADADRGFLIGNTVIYKSYDPKLIQVRDIRIGDMIMYKYIWSDSDTNVGTAEPLKSHSYIDQNKHEGNLITTKQNHISWLARPYANKVITGSGTTS